MEFEALNEIGRVRHESSWKVEKLKHESEAIMYCRWTCSKHRQRMNISYSYGYSIPSGGDGGDESTLTKRAEDRGDDADQRSEGRGTVCERGQGKRGAGPSVILHPVLRAARIEAYRTLIERALSRKF